MPDARLTAREVQVLRTLARSQGARKIAAHDLGISIRTVANHQRHAYAKLGAASLVDALDRLGWIKPGE